MAKSKGAYKLVSQLQEMPVVLTGVDKEGNVFDIGYRNPRVAVVVNLKDYYEREMTGDEFLQFAREVRANAKESAITGHVDLLLEAS